jgi:hypothetical protein
MPARAAAAPTASGGPSAFDRIAAAIERLYEVEPRLTRDLLQQLRSASVEDLQRLFAP